MHNQGKHRTNNQYPYVYAGRSSIETHFLGAADV